jgi:hypothetical protein
MNSAFTVPVYRVRTQFRLLVVPEMANGYLCRYCHCTREVRAYQVGGCVGTQVRMQNLPRIYPYLGQDHGQDHGSGPCGIPTPPVT